MPTYYGSKDVAALLVSGRSILSAVGQVSMEREAVLAPTTPLGVQWPTFQATGSKRATITQDGWFDHATGAANDAICEREGTEQVVCVLHTGNTRGNVMFAAAGAFAGKYTRAMASEAVHKAQAAYSVTGIAADAVILQVLAAVTTDGNTEATSVNNGSSSAAGGQAFLQCSALTLDSATNLVVKVRHSADNNTFADLVTFTALTAIGGESKAVSSATTVNQYLATSRAWTGGAGASSSATILVGFARG